MKSLVNAVLCTRLLAPVMLLSFVQPSFGGPKVLDQIEHEILRELEEPRVHFAIVCASRSCPRLWNRAYTAADLENQLVLNTKVIFADPGNFRHEPARRVLHLSSILSWFADDFGRDQATRLRAIAPYLPTREAYQAALNNSIRVSYLDYDWDLNDQTAARDRTEPFHPVEYEANTPLHRQRCCDPQKSDHDQRD